MATLCSMGVATLWSANIGALYPVIQMTLEGESIQSWLEKSLAVGKEYIEGQIGVRAINARIEHDALGEFIERAVFGGVPA